jgi:hypothetical protein
VVLVADVTPPPYPPDVRKLRRRQRRELTVRHFRNIIADVAIIVGVLITVGVYMYASVIILGRIG